MKKLVSLALSAMVAASTVVGLAACDDGSSGNKDYSLKPVAKEDVKVGLICLHDNSSTYDKNFIDAMERARVQLGLKEDQILMETGVPESSKCYDKAADFADQGCNVVFADSFGHEDYILQAAAEFPDVRFCHATGTKAHTTNLPNYHNAFASIYEGRYLAGVAAGMKLQEMIDAGKITESEAKMGYVGAYTYAEVISGYTSFYLGAKSVVSSVTMDVSFTGSWYDETAEKETATSLIEGGCVLISQHADSHGAPTACEEKKVPNVSYNGSTISDGPNTYIISSKIDWTPYFVYMIQCVIDGVKIDTDWCGGLSNGSVKLEALNENVAANGTQAKLDEVKNSLLAGTLHVFDTNNFTVTKTDSKNQNATVDANGKLTAYMADVNTDANFAGDTNVVENGVFYESKYRSAPYFDVQIDGITLKNAKF